MRRPGSARPHLPVALAVVALVVGTATAPSAAAPPARPAVTIGTGGWAFDANGRGQVVGYLGPDAFVWEGGRLRLLGSFGGTSAVAMAINRKGQVVGQWCCAPSPDPSLSQAKGFLWQAGVTTDVPNLGGNPTMALDINDRGVVVGSSVTPEGRAHAFRWTPGRPPVDLGTLGGTSSFAQGINERGDVVGYSDTGRGDEVHAFLWRDGRMLDLGGIGGAWSRASDVNDRGQVVGSAVTASGEEHGFLWEGGRMTDLSTVGGCSTVAWAIDDHGVVGGGADGHAVTWHRGVARLVEPSVLGESTWVVGIGDRGDLVGARGTSGDVRATLWPGAARAGGEVVPPCPSAPS